MNYKYTFLALLLSLFFLNCSSEEDDNTTSESGIEQPSGKRIKSIIYKGINDILKKTDYVYDSNGYLIETLNADTGELITSTEYDRNKIIKVTTNTIKSEFLGIETRDIKTTTENSYEYDNQNRVTKITKRTSSILEQKESIQIYNYDENRLIIHNPDSDVRVILFFDENNNVSKKEIEVRDNASNSFNVSSTTRYVRQNGLITKVWIEQVDPLSGEIEIVKNSQFEYVYDDNSNLIEEYAISQHTGEIKNNEQRFLYKKSEYVKTNATPYFSKPVIQPKQYIELNNLGAAFTGTSISSKSPLYELKKTTVYDPYFSSANPDNIQTSTDYRYELDDEGYITKTLSKELFYGISSNEGLLSEYSIEYALEKI